VARVAFGIAVGVVSTLLLAPQGDEFGAKVGLLAGLVVVCAAKPLFDRFLPEAGSPRDDLRAFLAPAVPGRAAALRLGGGVVAVALAAVAVVVAGSPARGTVLPDSLEALNRPAPVVDPATLPPITIDQEVIDFDHERAGDGMNEVVVALSQDLALETRALLEGDDELLAAVDHGDRLTEMQARLADARASGETTVEHFTFDEIHVSLLVPFGVQTGLSMGLTGQGTVVTERYDADGTLVDRETGPFHRTFAMRQATGERWMLVGVLPPATP
jgi:hypothetical protein